SESRIESDVMVVPALDSYHPPQPAEQHDEAEDHGERITVQITGLNPAHRRGDATDTGRRAVDQDIVDHAGIATLPQAATECESTAREYQLIQLVDVKLVVEKIPQRM